MFVLLLAALLVVLAACAGTQASTGQPSAQTQGQSHAQSSGNVQPDACTLLRKADAEKILGKKVDPPTHPVQMTETYIVDSCEYRVTGGTAAQNITLTLEVPADGDMAAARAAFDTGKQQAQAAFNAAPLDIPGLGDAAYWVGSSGNTLLVMKGSVTFTLSAYTVKGNTPNQLLLEQAKVVLGRLP